MNLDPINILDQKMDSIVELSDLEHLIDPYVSIDTIVNRWDSFLSSNNKPSGINSRELLAKTIVKKFNIDSGSISCLFDRRYKEKPIPISHDIFVRFTPPDLTPLVATLECEDSSIIEDIKNRFSYPSKDIINSTFFGPNNSTPGANDHSMWCHQAAHSDDPVHHGMLKCECHLPIPDDGFRCYGCENFYHWKHPKPETFIRFPDLEHEGSGGWVSFHCSYDCLKDIPPLGVETGILHEFILDITDHLLLK